MSILCPGYIGMASVGGKQIRCTDFSINPNQQLLFYDHIIGLNDTVPVGSETKGEEVGTIQPQKRIARPSPISIGGGFSFPAASRSSDNNFEDLFDHAKYGTYFDMGFQYHRGSGKTSRRFINCRVNQFTFSINASDILNISVDVFAKDMTDTGQVSSYNTSEKLVTWDKVEVSTGSVSSNKGIYGIEFTINNNLQNIYTNDSYDSFLPTDIRIGMQEVRGSLSVYDIPQQDFLDSSTAPSKIEITTPGFTTEINVVFIPQQISAVMGPIITQVPFVGVGKAFGE